MESWSKLAIQRKFTWVNIKISTEYLQNMEMEWKSILQGRYTKDLSSKD